MNRPFPWSKILIGNLTKSSYFLARLEIRAVLTTLWTFGSCYPRFYVHVICPTYYMTWLWCHLLTSCGNCIISKYFAHIGHIFCNMGTWGGGGSPIIKSIRKIYTACFDVYTGKLLHTKSLQCGVKMALIHYAAVTCFPPWKILFCFEE